MKKAKVKKRRIARGIRHRKLTGDKAVLAILESGDQYAIYELGQKLLRAGPGKPRVTVMMEEPAED